MSFSTYRIKYVSEFLRWFPPATPGKTRLAKRLLGECLTARDLKINSRRGLDFIAPSIEESVGFHLLIDGVYESEVLEYILSLLPPGGTFVDVGANIGSIAIPVAQRLGDGGRVVAIESSPQIFNYLERNVALNDVKNMLLVQCAATNTNWLETSFYEAPIHKFGMGSLGAQFNSSPIKVMTRTLDSILEEGEVDRVNVIKIDVEGFEASVLEGAKKTLTGPNPPLVVFEFCDWAEERAQNIEIGDAQRLLKDLGYGVWWMKDKITGKQPLREIITSGYGMLVAHRV